MMRLTARRSGSRSTYVLCVALGLRAFAETAHAAPDGQDPDMILRNGAIYLVQPENTWAEALAIREGKILAVGTNAQIEKFRRPDTKVIDLGGKMAMPGIVDVHVHIGEAAAQLKIYNCEISAYSSFDETLAAVKKCAESAKPSDWVVGQFFGSSLYGRLENADAIKQLNAASGGHPTVLRSDTIHDHWVNSRALELAGVTRSTPDPEGGKIGHDPKTGELNGLMIEGARAMIEKAVPQMNEKLTSNDLSKAISYLNGIGVTGFDDAAVLDNSDMMISTSGLFHELDQQGRLNAHVALSMLVAGFARYTDFSEAGIDKIFAGRETLRSKNLSMDFAKIMLDGVMVSRTSVFLEPYLPNSEHGNDYHGTPKVTQSELDRIVTSLDRRGVSVKVHVTGDGSVRMALDAIAAARKANGDTGPIHVLAHAGYVASEDIARLRTLRAAVDASPTVWYPGPVLAGTEAVLGNVRANHYFPFKSFVAQGVLVAGGTDWKTLPGEFSDLWDGMEGMVTRRNPTGHTPGALWPEEAVDVATMLRFYTLNSAKVLRIENKAGSIEVGKSADVIVLNQNVFKIPAGDISKTKVDMTIFEGKIISQR